MRVSKTSKDMALTEGSSTAFAKRERSLWRAVYRSEEAPRSLRLRAVLNEERRASV